MSTFVTQITSAMATRIEAVLPTYSALKYMIDVEKNDFRRESLRYGIVPLSAESAPTVARTYTIDHTFRVLLTDRFLNQGKTDSDQRSTANALYDKLDDLTKDFYNSKLGIASVVLLVTLSDIEEVEYLEDGVAVLRANFIVKYRRSL